MYKNLEAEMARVSIKRKDIADLLNIRYASVVDKMSGKFPFKLDEALTIKNRYFPNLSIEYLFDSEEAACRDVV